MTLVLASSLWVMSPGHRQQEDGGAQHKSCKKHSEGNVTFSLGGESCKPRVT